MSDLEALLARWRESRDPALGAIVVAAGADIGARVGDASVAPFAKLKPKPLAQALAVALHAPPPQHLTPLLGAVERLVRVGRGSWPIVELLAELPADPRVAALALALLHDFASLPHTSAKLWRRLVDAVEHHGDPSAIAPLAALSPRDPSAATAARLANVGKRLARTTPIAAAELAAVRAASASLPDTPRVVASTNGDALLAAIYASPADDAPRGVYADWLTAHGDPRGEFIALQLARAAGTLTPAGARREHALLMKHWRTWLGPLAPLLRSTSFAPDADVGAGELGIPDMGFERTTFARGFVSRLQPLVVPKHRVGIYDDPIFATVTRADELEVVTPVMRGLRAIVRTIPAALHTAHTLDDARIELPPPPAVRELAGVRVRRLTIDLPYSHADTIASLAPSIHAATADNRELRAIRLVGSHHCAWHVAWSWRARGAPHLESFALHMSPRERLELRGGELVADTAGEPIELAWRAALAAFTATPVPRLAIRATSDAAGRALAGLARELAVAATIAI